MELSYWEISTWLSELDYCIVGSGITGLSCALELREMEPEARIIIIEKGILPQGASTKNAGFACFGSLTEILSDLERHTEEEVVQLVADRRSGIELLRMRLGDTALDYHQWGGYEVFLKRQSDLFEHCLDRMEAINRMLEPVFGKDCFRLAENTFGFDQVLPELILHPFEGQIDTGQMMKALLQKAQQGPNPITILNGVRLNGFDDLGNRVFLQTNRFEFSARKVLLATNGFSGALGEMEVDPARAQVLVTEPVAQLPIRGTFHMDEGYYYFRNAGDRILLGGGRNLNIEGETTMSFGNTHQIQQALEQLLREVILPGQNPKIAHRWSGIMGVGAQKRPVIRHLSENVACGVRLGGMGVAIGSHVGRQLASLGSR